MSVHAQNYSGPYAYGSGPPAGYDEEATAWAAYHEHFQARATEMNWIRIKSERCLCWTFWQRCCFGQYCDVAHSWHV